MNAATNDLLTMFGFENQGIDPTARDHQLYALPADKPAVVISVPSGGCDAKEIVRIIFHSGAAAARQELDGKYREFLQALTRA